MVGYGQMGATNLNDMPAKEIKDLKASAGYHLQEVEVKAGDDGM